ncbi:MAG: S8 family serine peptidase [Xanthomonadales bacterium]|nr:S8 family serine peptidase [Xanthomonadales bacterium]
MLPLFLLMGCNGSSGPGDAVSAKACGDDVVIADDGIFNPHNIALSEPHRVTMGPLPPASPAPESYPIPAENICGDGSDPGDGDPGGPVIRPKISAVLQDWLDERQGTERIQIIIRLLDRLPIPRLPPPRPPLGADSEDDDRRKAIDGIIRAREDAQQDAIERLRREFQFEPSDRFWLVNAVAGEVELQQVRRIAELDDVAYIQPVRGGEKPPGDVNPNNDAEDGRADIQSDPYFNLGLGSGSIGLIDTGVFAGHNLLSSPGQLNYLLDCVHGGTACDDTTAPQYNAGDPYNHGTRSAALLTGGTALGPEFRGITQVSVDSWRVYSGTGDGTLDSAATINAIQAAVRIGSNVLVVETEANESENGAIAIEADTAYDTGAIIVAANGNHGPVTRSVRSPAIAHKVIGVGGYKIETNQTLFDQSLGSATDGRFKPDIQAPSYTETAITSSPGALDVYGGTSGATPYAGGAAMLAYNWLQQHGVFENGHVYAFMILYGQRPWTGNNTTHNEVGAGPLQMATDGWAWWGKVVAGHGMTIDIPINITAGKVDLEVAAWWPEDHQQAHANIELYAIDNNGQILAASEAADSVWERARVTGPLAAGSWKIRIAARNVPSGNRVVYWAAHVHNQ